MKTATFKTKIIKIFFLILVFTSLSGFSQKYITDWEEWSDIESSYDYIADFGKLKELPIIKNAECKEPTRACFLKELQIFIKDEFDASLSKELKGKKIYWQFIVKKNGEIEHIYFKIGKTINPVNIKFYKEASRVINKLLLIGGAKDFRDYADYKGKNVAFLFRGLLPLK